VEILGVLHTDILKTNHVVIYHSLPALDVSTLFK